MILASLKTRLASDFLFFLPLIFLLFLSSPKTVFSKTIPKTDAWHSIEQSLLQVYERYAPDSPISKKNVFAERVSAYLEMGLWSSAEVLLDESTDPSVERLRLELMLCRQQYTTLYESYETLPGLFSSRPDLILAAAQGALAQLDFNKAIQILDVSKTPGHSNPKQLYLSALAYWGLKDHTRLHQTFDKARQWHLEHGHSSWIGRIDLLKVYFHLNQEEYELAFQGIGNVFQTHGDLALLALTWGYFKLDASENLLSMLQAFDEDEQISPHFGRIYRILSRFLIKKGNLRGAIEMDQKERDELKRRMAQLEKETEDLRKGSSAVSLDFPPGSLLSDALHDLKAKTGSHREITTLLWYIDLEQRKQSLKHLKSREKAIEIEQRALQMEMIRRCMSIRQLDFQQNQRVLTDTEINQIYRRARLAANAGAVPPVVKALRKIISIQAEGPHAEESHFRLGNLAFNAENYSEAIRHYQVFTHLAHSSLYRAAQYKLAWSYYLNGQPEPAIQLLIEQELDLSVEQDDSMPCVVIRTPQEHREPYRLLAYSLKALGGPEHLLRLVHQRQPGDSFRFISKVADYYESEKRLREMFELIGSWVAKHPLYTETPFLHERLVSYVKQSIKFSIEDVLKTRETFVRAYGPGSTWASTNRPETSEGVKLLLKNHLQFLMTHYYANGKKTGEPDDIKMALPWYLRYLALFSADKDAGRIRYLYADILMSLDEERAAMVAYQQSAYNDSPHQRSAEAGYREILLLEKHHQSGAPEIEQGYDRFVMSFPTDKRSEQISIRLAEIAFGKRDYAKSRYYAERLLPNQGRISNIQGIEVSASRLVVQAYLKESAYPDAIQFLKVFLNRSLNHNTLQEFKSLLTLALFEHGEALKLRGKTLAAADAFFKTYEKGATSKLGPLALFEAAVLWDRPATRQQAEMALDLFYTRYASSALYYPALIRLAGLYQNTQRPIKGAEIYEEASRLPVNTERVHQALDQAIKLYEKSGKWKNVFKLVMERAGQNPDREKEGTWMVKAAEAKLKLGEKNDAKNILNRLIKSASEEETGTDYISKAHFLLAEIKLTVFSRIKLVSPLNDNLQKKTTLFEDLLNAYHHAMGHPSFSVTINANHRIGEIFEEFSRALLYSERPEGLSSEETAVYDDLLKEQALPYIERAEEAYLENIEFGESMDIDNEWTRKSAVRLKQIYKEMDFMDPDEEVFS